MWSLNSFFGDSKTIAAAVGKPGAADFMGPQIPTRATAKKKSLWENVFGAATFVAKSAGARMPMDSEIASLENDRKTLSSLRSRMDLILNWTKSRSDTGNLRTTASQAKAQATAAIRLIDAALTDGKLAQERMKYGTKALGPSATFFTKKTIADRTFSLTKNRLQLVFSSWETASRRHMAQESLPSQIKQATKSTVVEFGGKVSRGVVRFGKIAEATAESAAKGGEQFGYLAKYAIPIGIGVVALYAISMGRSTGAGVGRAFESVGSGVGEAARSYRRRS
jgi:hypothetical protein